MLVKKYWLPVFLFLLASDAVVLLGNYQAFHFLFKFMLMPVLMIGLLQYKKDANEKNWRLILAGLVTAWAGDVLLLFSANRELFFTLGLVCFLCTHLAYIVYFNRYHRRLLAFISQQPVVSFITIAFAACLLAFLWTGLGALRVPVVVYTLVITAMVLQSFASRQYVTPTSGGYFVIGAIFFIVSDSLLAIAKFRQPFLFSDAAIMITYGIAQLLILLGTINNTDSLGTASGSTIRTSRVSNT